MGRLEGDASSRRDRQGALRRVEPHVDGHAVPRRRHGRSFMPIRSMLGSDVRKQRPEAVEIDCPFTGDKILLVPLNPDVALIHVQRCDPYGNAQIDGLQFMDIDLAIAANKVILTTERIVSNDQIRRAPDRPRFRFCGRCRRRAAVRMRPARMLRRLRADASPCRTTSDW